MPLFADLDEDEQVQQEVDLARLLGMLPPEPPPYYAPPDLDAPEEAQGIDPSLLGPLPAPPRYRATVRAARPHKAAPAQAPPLAPAPVRRSPYTSFDTRTKTWNNGVHAADMPMLPSAPRPVPQMQPVDIFTGKPQIQNTPAAPVMGVAGVPLPAPPPSMQIDPEPIYRAAKQSYRKFAEAAAPLMRNNPELGGAITEAPPTPDDFIRFQKTTEELPVLPFSAGAQPGTAMHGVLSGLESATTPSNLLMAAGMALSGGVGGAGMQLLHRGLGTYFGWQMAKGAGKNVSEAYDAYKKDPTDLDTVAEKLGQAGVQSVFAFLGLKNIKGAKDDLFQRIERQNAANEAELQRQQAIGRQQANEAYRTVSKEALAQEQFGQPVPVKIGDTAARIELSDVDKGGRPSFNVVDEATNEPLFGGYGGAVRSWLASKGANMGDVPDLSTPAPIVGEAPESYRPGTLMRNVWDATEPAPPVQEVPITPDDIGRLQSNPEDIRNPRKREQRQQHQEAIGNRVQLAINEAAARVDPLAGLDTEFAEGAGAQAPHTVVQDSLVPQADGTYLVRDMDGTVVFHGPLAAAQQVIQTRNPGSYFGRSITAAEAGVEGAPPQRPAPDMGAPVGPTAAPVVETGGSLAELPQEQPAKIEAAPPSKVEKPSDATPNAPTAAKSTAPEKPESIAVQMEQLAAGIRKAVMIPKGTPQPTSFGDNISITNDGLGNTYAYRRDLTTEGEIKAAAKGDKLPQLLGDAVTGLQAPDKKVLDLSDGEKFTVVVRAADGTEVQATATDEEHLSATLAAHERLVPPGGSVHIEPAEQVVGERAGAEPGTNPDWSVKERDQDAADRKRLGERTASTPVETPSTQVETTEDLGTPAEVGTPGRPNSLVDRARELLAALGDPKPTSTPVETPSAQVATPEDLGTPAEVGAAPASQPRSYDEVQRDIDQMEDDLEKQGVNLSRLYFPSEYNDKTFAGSEWKPMPPEMAKLYAERDAIADNEDNELVSGIDARLKDVVPDDKLRAGLVRTITETDQPYAIRLTKGHQNIANLGRIANAIVKHVAEHVTHEEDDHWEQVKARLGGTPENPGVQLYRGEVPQGYVPYTEKTYEEAQKILDALMEGNAPKYPTRVPLETYQAEEPEQIAAPADLGTPAEIEAPQPERREERRSAPRATRLEQPDLPRSAAQEDAQLAKDIRADRIDRGRKSYDEVEERFNQLRQEAETGSAELSRLGRIAEDPTHPERSRQIAREGAKAAREQVDKAFKELGEDYGDATYLLRQRLGEQYGLTARFTRPKLQAPVTYFTGGAAHYEDVQKAARERNDLGLVITPKTSHYTQIHEHYPQIMVDNGVFSKEGFKEDAFRRLLDRVDATPGLKKKIQFVVAPDVMVHDEETGDVRGDAEATLDQFEKWADELHARDLPVAFVAQPGIEHMLDEVPWDKVDTLFIGGHKPWKFGNEVKGKAWIQIFSEAHKRGIPIHVGRAYRAKDIEHVHVNLGVRTVDSTHIAYEPSKALPFILRQLQRWNVDERLPKLYDEGDMIRAEEELDAQINSAAEEGKPSAPAAKEDLGAPESVEQQEPVEAPAAEKPQVTWLNDDFGNFSLPTSTELVSKSGRKLVPSPHFSDSTPRRRTNSLNRQRKWLVDEARKEAEATGDRHALATWLKAINPDNYSRSDADTVNEYLFGDTSGPTEKNILAPTPAPQAEKAPETPEAALVAAKPKPAHLKPGQSLREAIDEITEEFRQHLDEGPDADRGERKRIVNRALDLRMKPKDQRTSLQDTTIPADDLAYWESKLRPHFDALHKLVSASSAFHGKKITPETKASEMSPAEFATHRPEQAHALPKSFTESLLGKPQDWTAENLEELPKKKLDSLLTMHGLGTSGTKAQQAARLIENRDLQAKYEGKTAEDLAALPGKELDALLDTVGVGKYGAKPIRAATFLGELAKRRARGLSEIARWNHQLAVEREKGGTPPSPADLGTPAEIGEEQEAPKRLADPQHKVLVSMFHGDEGYSSGIETRNALINRGLLRKNTAPGSGQISHELTDAGREYAKHFPSPRKERAVEEALGDLSTALQQNAAPERLREVAGEMRLLLDENPEVGENLKTEGERLIKVAEARIKPEDLAPPQDLGAPADIEETTTLEADAANRGERADSAERGGTDRTRAEDTEALAPVSPELREESRGEERPVSDRGPGGNRPLRDLQRDEESGLRSGSSDGSSTGGVDQPRERPERAERPEYVASGDLTRESSNRDFRITSDTGVGEGTAREKLTRNLDAIRIVKQLQAEGRPATVDEQRQLARYVGWGGMPQIFDWRKDAFEGAREELRGMLTPEEYKAAEASTKNAHYTSPMVVVSMWNALQRFGLKPGFTMIEPSMGIGNFFGLQPDSLLPSRRTGVELDQISGAIAKALYPDSNVQVTGFEKIALPDDFFDVAISNVPFGNYGVYDPKYKRNRVASQSIHNYFFVKGLDLVRPGGIVAFITSRYTMDAESTALRQQLADKADLVGMIRLPDTAFKGNAGTEVVTDMIFLRKRPEGQAASGPAFTATREVDTADGGKTVVNEYYAENPDMMLGQLRLEGSMYAANQQTLKGDLTPEILQAAIEKLPQGIYSEWKAESPAFEDTSYAQLGDIVKDGGYDVKDGVVVQREGSIYRPVQVGKTAEARIKGMIPLRAALHEVFRTQLEEASEKDIVAARKKLNQVYDAFVKKFGPVNAKGNGNAFGEDPDYAVMAGALEDDYDKETNVAKKAAIFTQRTIEKPKTPEKADRASEALAIVLNERGRLDWDRMQQLTGRTPDEMREELGGIVYQNPDGRKWETQDDYLSGNVRAKLELAQQAAKADPRFERNVEALEKVQPRDLSPEEIRVTLGAPWVPAEYVSQFLRTVLDLDGATARYTPTVATWSVNVQKWTTSRTANTTTHGTDDYAAHELVDLALNGKGPRVYRAGPNDTRVLDPKATAAAQAAQDALKEKFKEWIWEQRFAEDLAKKYNREMNNLRLVEHDGSHLTLPGSNSAITLRPHQKNVIWRALKTGNTLLAHEVGAGKTWEMVGIAMESRRLGLAKKPILVVPNHMAEQVATEFAQLYPAARVLTVGKDDFAAGRRQKAIARIAGGTWDAIIIRHSSFERIPVSDETYQAFVDSQIRELRAALEDQKKEIGKGADKDKTVKEIQKAISRLEVKLQKRLSRENKDKGANFEQLGVDLMLVDEAHAFKALPIITRRTRVAGVPTRESNRATDMYMKTQYIANLNGGSRGVIFATGTPVTNTMAELYNMQRYLQGKALTAAGVAHFDAWANTFGEVLRGVELDVSGKGFRENERFAKFINVPELMTMYRQVADVKTAEMMKLPRPDLVGGAPQAITAPESPELTKLVDSLVKRTERIRGGKVDKSEDNMLKVVSEGKKAALDMRLIDPDAEDRPDSKVNKAVDNIFSIWRNTKADKATQIVFCDLSTPKAKKAKKGAKVEEEQQSDEEEGREAVPEAAGERAGFSVYDDMKAKLISRGIPEAEIAFIHDYDSDAKKQELFDAVNAGKVRVLMGSTEKMGVGTNVQKRAIALHHMDAPWRPADIKQRDGRIQRQGNMHKQVHIFQYLTEGSFDAYSWQLLENKARFIGPVLSGELSVREMEDVGMVLPSAAEFKAMASGNPIIKEKIGTDAALGRLDAQRVNFRKQQAGVRSQLANLPSMIDSTKRVLNELTADVATVEKNKDVGLSVGNQKFTGDDARKEAAEALANALESWRGPSVPQHIGSYRGLEIWTRPGTLLDTYPGLTLRGKHSYNTNTSPENPASTLQSIESTVRNIKDRLPSWQKTLDEHTKKFTELKAEEGKAWPQEAKYQELVKKKAEIDAQLAESEAEKAASEKAANEEVGDASVTLGFGLGALQPAFNVTGKAVKDFSKDIVLPKVQTILQGTGETVSLLAHVLSPTTGVPSKTVDMIFRMKGGREAAQHLLRARLKKWSKRVDKMSQAEMVDFIDRQKTGQAQVDQEMQDLADFLRQADDDLFNEVQRYHPSVNYLDNHYRVLWDVIPGATKRKGFKGLFRKPLRGGRGFLRQSKLADMSDGLAQGGIPYTYNPIKNFELHYQDTMKFITAQRMWEEFGTTGVRKFVRKGKDEPPGYTKLKDSISRVYFPVKQGLVDAGDWYVEEGAARMLNNYLGTDHIRRFAPGRGLMWIKNASTALELAISPFHAVFEGNEAISSQIGMGLRQIWNLGVLKRDPKAALKGVRTIATAPGAFYTFAHEGRLAKMAFEDYASFSQSKAGQDWLKKYPQARKDFEDFFNAGGKMGQHEDYKTGALASLKEYWNSASAKDPKNYMAAALVSPAAANQALMKPLFEKYIPYLKLGFFMREYNLAKLEYADRIASGEMTYDQLARSIVRSIDNRFGELNYDNLFWDQTFKTANQLIFRSVTWKLGNLRANVSAFTGAYKELHRWMTGGGPPKLNMDTSWLFGMSFWTALAGGVIFFIATGKLPRRPKDVVYPIIDAANGIRVSMPTYWRDIVHLWHSPLGYVKSSLTGEIGRMADVWQNKEFHGNEVYNADDPLYRQAWDLTTHFVTPPFSVSSYRQAGQEGGSRVAEGAGFFGFTKAPKYIEQSDAEQLAGDYLNEHREVGSRTRQQAERSQAKAAIRNLYRAGKTPDKQVRDAEAKGYISPKDVYTLRREAQQPNLVRMVQSLYGRQGSLPQLLKIYDTATQEERKAIEPMVRKKVMASRLKPYLWNRKSEDLAFKYFKLRPYHPPAASGPVDLGTPAAIEGTA